MLFTAEAMPISHQPLVSCICVTHNHIDVLKKSISCFQNQTYANKELIVAFTDDNHSAAELVAGLKDPAIKPLVFPSDESITLGEKRNSAIAYASGFYCCVWDDDDWHHINRIIFHVKSLYETGYKSSALSNVILYDHNTDEAYLSATRQGWEQTLFCEKSVFENPELRYLKTERGEDSSLLFNLKKSGWLLTISKPSLYVYVYHGKNTFHRGHWEVNILPWATKFSPQKSLIIKQIVEGKLSNSGAAIELQKFLD